MGTELATTGEMTETIEPSANLQDRISQEIHSLELKKTLSTSVDNFDFSQRVLNICLMADIDTIADLVRYSKKDFGALRNSGKKSVDEVEAFLESNKLSWKMKN
jgi:DNA-directed RNA polymerase alpha subunit